MRVRSALTVAAYVVLAGSAALILFAYFGRFPAINHPLDDAYISYRYALNTAAGHWFEWNRGEAPSEGFTNLLFVVLIAIGSKLGLSPPVGALALNTVTSLASSVAILQLCQLVRRGIPTLALIAVALWLGDMRTAYTTGTGLETQLNVFLLIAHLLLVCVLVAKPRRAIAIASAFAALGAGLTRPESAVMCLLAYVPLAIHLARKRDHSTLGFSVGLYGLLGFAYLAWKLAFFGYLFPNAFYIKSVDPAEWVGLARVLEFARYDWMTLALALASLPLLVRRGFATQALAALLPLLFGVVYFSTVLHEMSPHFRYEAPVYAYATALASVGLHALWSPARSVQIASLAGTALGVYAAIFFVRNPGPLPRAKTEPGPPMVWFACAGEALGATQLGHDAVLHIGAAGRIPYESDFYHVDVGAGIVENALCGRQPITPVQKREYIDSKPADVIFSKMPPALPDSQRPEDDAAFMSEYVQAVTLGKADAFSVLRQYRLRGYDMDRRSKGTWSSMIGLRDDFVAVGRSPIETRNGLRQYAYVSRRSKYRDVLVEALRPCHPLPATPEETAIEQPDADASADAGKPTKTLDGAEPQ